MARVPLQNHPASEFRLGFSATARDVSLRLRAKYLIHDRDANFGTEVIKTIETLGAKPKRTTFKSPWQNGVAERFVGNCRRDLLDHVIILNERHHKRLMTEYVGYYHEDRTHLALAKETPACREAAVGTEARSKIIAMPRLGGLHHRYDLAA